MMTGNDASDSSFAAEAIAPSPPSGGSKRTMPGSSTSITCVQKSRGTLICAGARPRCALRITRLSTSAMREASRTSS